MFFPSFQFRSVGHMHSIAQGSSGAVNCLQPAIGFWPLALNQTESRFLAALGMTKLSQRYFEYNSTISSACLRGLRNPALLRRPAPSSQHQACWGPRLALCSRPPALAPRSPCYLLYSSTINCSFTGVAMSSRLGRASTRPFRFSRSTSSQPTTGWWLEYSRAPSITVNFLALSRTWISSPALTWNEGMFTL